MPESSPTTGPSATEPSAKDSADPPGPLDPSGAAGSGSTTIRTRASRNPFSLVRWLFAPAVEAGPRGHAVGATVLRLLLGMLWVYNVAWKRAPDFGREAGNGLYKFTSYAVEYPVFPPFSSLAEQVILPHIALFGWGVLVSETVLAVLLLTGAWVRLACVLGIAQSLAIGLSVAYAPEEWPWAYWLMIGAHLLLLVSTGGRLLAVDAVRARLATGRGLATAWGTGALLVGLYSLISSAGDPFAASGSGLSSTDVSMSLGTYNAVGGLVLLVAGVLLLLATRVPVAATVAGLLALAAALSLYVQNGFSDPVLGGSPTSAAYYLGVAVVAATVVRAARRGPARVPESREDTRR